jgi:hypothetical protein
VRNVHAVGKRLIRPGERFGWKTEVTRFVEAMRRKGHVYMPFGL